MFSANAILELVGQTLLSASVQFTHGSEGSDNEYIHPRQTPKVCPSVIMKLESQQRALPTPPRRRFF
jgi:hypothetical protein